MLVTGVPGWLTEALLTSMVAHPPQGLNAIHGLVQRGVVADEQSITRKYSGSVDIVSGDVRDADSLRSAVKGIDTVFHSAGVLHVKRTREWYDVNTDGTRALAKAAAAAGVKRFVFISSNAAAGRSPSRDHLLTEQEPPNPLSHYGKSKWLAEQAVNALGDRMEVVIIRPCMFYGPPVPRRHVEVYQRIVDGHMPLVGDGNFARSVSHIDNLVQGCRLALEHPAAAGQTYYIADRAVYTTKQVTEAMADALGVTTRFVRLPRAIGPVAYGVDMALAATGLYWQTLHLVGESDWHVGVSIDKACRELGYDPRVEIAQGMRQAVEWCVSNGLLKLP